MTASRACSVGVFRRHPPEDMEDAVPRLRSVAAEIETPGASPRSAATSPSSDPHHSGDSFTQAFMHQARRLRSAVLDQKVPAPLQSATPLAPCRLLDQQLSGM